MRLSFKINLAILLGSLLALGPLAAFATSHLSLTVGGNQITSIQAGNNIDAVLDGPILTVGQTSQRLSAMWSPASLQLKDNNITYPAGWGLEYTVDGISWTQTAPQDLTTVVGIRTSGNVSATDVLVLTSATPVSVTSGFSGSSGGDGLNLIFAGDRVFNIFHHNSSLVIDCHLTSDGSACHSPATKTFTGYYTGNASQGYWDNANKKLYAQTAKLVSSSWKLGVTCVDYSTLSNPVLCSTPWIELGSTSNTFGSAANDLGTSAQLGTKIYIPNAKDSKMMCFDMATSAACPSNGFQLPNAGVGGATEFGRASAIDGRIYFATYGYIGCFDPSASSGAGALCNSASTGIAENTHASQYPLIPIRDSAGVLTSVCFLPTQQCMTPDTNTAVSNAGSTGLPSVLITWETNTPVPAWNTFNAGMWAEQGNKLYLNQGPSASATGSVYCFDFTTSAACSGFGTNGVASGVGVEIYFIQNDPTVANCLWTIGNTGVIRTFNGLTGAVGCSLAHPLADVSFSTSVTRLSCSGTMRTASWNSVVVSPGNSGIALSDMRVSVLNSSGQAITNYVDLTPNGSGAIDLTQLTTLQTGATPTFRLSDWSSSPTPGALTQVQTTINSTVETPQLCFALVAVQSCPNVTLPQGDTSVANGLLRTKVLSTPTSGPAMEQVEDRTLNGTNTSATCTPYLASFVPPPSNTVSTQPNSTLPSTGVNQTSIFLTLIVGLLAMSIGFAGVSISRLRRS